MQNKACSVWFKPMLTATSYQVGVSQFPTVPNLFDAKYLNLSYPELLDVGMAVKLDTTKEKNEQVERDTVEQAKGINFDSRHTFLTLCLHLRYTNRKLVTWLKSIYRMVEHNLVGLLVVLGLSLFPQQTIFQQTIFGYTHKLYLCSASFRDKVISGQLVPSFLLIHSTESKALLQAFWWLNKGYLLGLLMWWSDT